MRIRDWSSDVCSSDLVAAFEQRRDVRVVLPLLEGLPRLELGVAVVQAADVAQRDPVLVEVIEEAAAVGVRVERPPQRMDHLARLHAPGWHLPQFLDADRIGLRVAVRSEEHTSELQSQMRNSD